MSDLIQVILNDRSATVAPIVGSVGATVIKSNRGGGEPVLFYPRQESRIIDYFGIPDTGNEAVDDILAYNRKYPVWVSSPSEGSRYGGAFVTLNGVEPFVGGKTSKDIDFTNIDNYQSFIQSTDGLITNFIAQILNPSYYVHQSIDILVNGVSIDVVASDAEPELLTCALGSGTFTRNTGDLDFTFLAAPASGDNIEIYFKTDVSSKVYFALFNKNPQEDDLQISVTATGADDFAIYLKKKKNGSYVDVSGFPKTVSITKNYLDGFGVNIFAENVFQNSDYITAKVYSDATYATFTNSSNINFTGGLRGVSNVAALTAGWDYFKLANKFPADIFFDTTTETSIISTFENLRNAYQKYSFYILPTSNKSVEDVITDYSALTPDNKGIALYWGWGKINNPYTGSIMASSLMGRRALRLADMHDAFNGLAPAWYNENGTHGGQLGSGIIEMFYDANDTQQANLEVARINPTIMHPTFGAVLTRERTSQSLRSDYSSIGHVRLADYLIKNIITQALPYQLYKLNDDNHRTTVRTQIETIINPVSAEPFNLLREFIVKCDSENNNDDVLAREEFVVAVGIKFTPFSKFIKLFFTNSAQGTSVEEVV